MKKFLIRTVSLTLMLAMVLSVPVVAQADNINLGVQVKNGTDTITVTVDNSAGTNAVLAEQKPTLTIPCSFDLAHVKCGDEVVPSARDGGNISFTVTRGGVYTICNSNISGDENEILLLEDEVLQNQSLVWIDGTACPVEKDGNNNSVLLLPKDSAMDKGTSIVTYNYHVGDAGDRYTQYPTGMQVWIIKEDDQGNLKPTHVEELDNILGYCGTSIRIVGNRGIRMITSVEQSKKNALTAAGLAGYKLLEYGTAVCWSDNLTSGKSLTLNQPHVQYNYAYKRGVDDPVFKIDGEQMQYTNVLVGYSMEACGKDIAMRPYMILEGPDGEQVTIYGGIVHRSIGHIAYRNRNVFAPGSDAYKYIWNIIHEVYGKKYDAEYKKG